MCFLVGVVALASAAAAALRLCPVYLGVAHFTKVESAQTAAELASGAIAPLELALAVRCRPLVVTLAKEYCKI